MGNQEKEFAKILAIDTSTASLAVAVLDRVGGVAQSNTRAERNHSIYMMQSIQDTLKDAGLTISEIDGIVVGIGPGSYTGIRIAVTTAKTLAWSLKIPVVGVSSLEGTALGAFDSIRKSSEPSKLSKPSKSGTTDKSSTQWVIPLVDARRGQVYTGLYQLTGVDDNKVDTGQCLPVLLESDRITLMTHWCDVIAQRWTELPEEERPDGICFVGETTEPHMNCIREKLGKLLGDQLYIHPYELEAKWLGLCGRHALEQGKQSEVHALVPNYTQLAEAETALLTKK